ncbi:hypothetical protein RHS01_09818 [Rhizoctonia solani]|uniref:Uncharacterized protein n=1 Tax=Rhizoctonia solani TaxID=456999 RepID=A0A8H7M322_9AGAM|nr:hypothetical protein RHS01_09818 [Rhizoctonia solani]
MNTQQDQLGSENGPLIDFTGGGSESGSAGRSSVSQELGSLESYSASDPNVSSNTSPVRPFRSVRELVESLGSPIYSDASISSRASPVPRSTSNQLDLISLSRFEDPISFGDPESYHAWGSRSPPTTVRRTPPSSPPDQNPTPEQSQNQSNSLNVSDEEPPCPSTPMPTQSSSAPYIPPAFRSVVPPGSYAQTSTAPSLLSSTRPDFPYARQPSSSYIRQTNRSPPATPQSSYPWNQPSMDTLSRPDRFSRTTAHTAISDILFNFDLDPSGAPNSFKTHARPHASRVDVGAGLELVLWLMENTKPWDVDGEVRKGCLMRCNGMGEQVVWNILRSFVPDVDGEGEGSAAYDVDVEGLAFVRVGASGVVASPVESEDDDDESDQGSLYDDVSIIDPDESMYLDQADIETLKSSSDERDQQLEAENQTQEVEELPSRIHRARIVLPSFKESLTGPSWSYTSPSRGNRFGMAPTGSVGDKLLIAEWMFEGRIWALSIGEDTLLLTLRQTSSVVSSDPLRVQAIVRILPLDMHWNETKPIDQIGSDRLLPTEIPSDTLLSSPLYEWESEEKELVPGPVGVGSSSSIWKTKIRASDFSILELAGEQSGIKVEVMVRTREKSSREVVMEASTSVGVGGFNSVALSIADDASDWQFVDD